MQRASLLASALVLTLAACGGGEEPAESDASGTPSATATEPAAADEAGYPVGTEGLELTEPGTTLDLGERATVAWQVGGGEVGVAELRVDRVREVTLEELEGWVADGSMKESRPYFVDVTVENAGETDLGGQEVPVLLMDSNGVLGPPWSFGGQFRPCNSGPLPGSFEPGEKKALCLVYLAPQGASIDAMAFAPVDGFEPIRWTGDVQTPADEKKPRGRKQR
ncbi:hypothetical protein DDE18_09325 [Nocardioides gansuensis]|uniref:DUF4352 domain-containing protein n=1 Tax=Nocardioides gansuensis TaxID=2138300 RepID=A0A2T8FCN3_9ACTN|nr:hypothetical protein [Nocardioides gansuensis]PVG83471.1 hypothetical protein DDE18_09325 [Nocardioides gansuensis]